jgi:hypothetical protein
MLIASGALAFIFPLSVETKFQVKIKVALSNSSFMESEIPHAIQSSSTFSDLSLFIADSIRAKRRDGA